MVPTYFHRQLVFTCIAAVACGNGRDEGPLAVGSMSMSSSVSTDSTGGVGSTTAADTSGPTTAADTSGPVTTPDSTGMTKFDVGGSADRTGGSDDGSSCDPSTNPNCTGCTKVDFLFVVDNSSSMGSYQENLRNSFGPFIDTITSEIKGNDYHIMLVDSDACSEYGAFVGGCGSGMGCDVVLGAGQVRDCPIPGGVRYLTSADPNLKSNFQCMANVGLAGDREEMVVSAAVEAIGPVASPGQCNEGFLRDDALLVITIISDDHSGYVGDDNENGFGGTPQSWYDAILEAKGNNVKNIVVLGLIAIDPPPSCSELDGEWLADQFKDFVEMFGSQGIVGSVCEPDYNDPFFQNAVNLIDITCDEFVPPQG